MDTTAKKLAGFIATSSLACIGFGLAGFMGYAAFELIGTVAGTIASDQITYFNFKRLKSWITSEDPDELNHDLQKGLILAMLQAIDHVQTLFKKHHPDHPAQKEITKIFKTIKKDLSTTFPPHGELADGDLKDFLYDDPEDSLKQLYTRIDIRFKEHKEVSDFFKDHFVQQVQLSFGELLKEEEHTKIWRAFQRLIAEEVRFDVKEMLKKQDELHDALKEKSDESTVINIPALTSRQIKALKDFTEELKQPLKLDRRLRKALDTALDKIQDKVDEILSLSRDTNVRVARVEISLDEQGTKIDDITDALDDGWYSKKYITLLGATVALLIAAGSLTYYFYTQPFPLMVQVHGVKGKSDRLLQDKGSVQLRVGNFEQSVPIDGEGKAYFSEIPWNYKNQKARFSIVETQGEPYQVLEEDSLYTLRNGDAIFLESTLSGLDSMKGIVKDFQCGDPLEGVRVSIIVPNGDNLETITNEYGEYSFEIPLEHQKKFQSIRAMKEDYQIFELNSVPTQTGKEIPIPLTKKNPIKCED